MTDGEFLTAGELAARLKVSPITVRQWQSFGVPPPPSRRWGKLRRYVLDEVVKWLEEGHSAGVSERIRARTAERKARGEHEPRARRTGQRSAKRAAAGRR